MFRPWRHYYPGSGSTPTPPLLQFLLELLQPTGVDVVGPAEADRLAFLLQLLQPTGLDVVAPPSPPAGRLAFLLQLLQPMVVDIVAPPTAGFLLELLSPTEVDSEAILTESGVPIATESSLVLWKE